MKLLEGARARIPQKSSLYVPLILGTVFMLLLILHYDVNTPNEDEWDLVPLFQATSNHTLGLANLWAQHNEHRMFFPTLVLLGNAYVTRWNTISESLLCLLFAFISAALLLVMLGQSLRQKSVGVIAAALVAAWFFSPVQWESWMSGLYLEWFMCVTGALAAIFLLLKVLDATTRGRRWVLMVFAVLAAIVSSYSLANGLLVWIVGVLMLAIGKQSRGLVLAWLVTGVLTAALYYYNYVQLPTPTGTASAVLRHHPVLFVGFVVEFMGAIVGSDKGNLQAPGIVGFLLLLCLIPLLYVVWQRRKEVRSYLPWLSVIAFALLSDVSVAYGRLGFGVTFALNSRYSAFSLLYIIGVLGLVFTLVARSPDLSQRKTRQCAWSIALVCLPLLMSSYNVGIRGFQKQSAYLEGTKVCTSKPYPSDACLWKTYPGPQIVRPRLTYIKDRGWAGYSEGTASKSTSRAAVGQVAAHLASPVTG